MTPVMSADARSFDRPGPQAARHIANNVALLGDNGCDIATEVFARYMAHRCTPKQTVPTQAKQGVEPAK